MQPRPLKSFAFSSLRGVAAGAAVLTESTTKKPLSNTVQPKQVFNYGDYGNCGNYGNVFNPLFAPFRTSY
jgi:hypothetical protein